MDLGNLAFYIKDVIYWVVELLKILGYSVNRDFEKPEITD